MAKRKTREKKLGGSEQGVLFANHPQTMGNDPMVVSSDSRDQTQGGEHAHLIKPHPETNIHIKGNSLIEPLVIGAPVVFHGNVKKIRDANLYRGEGDLKPEERKGYIPTVYSPIFGLAADNGMIDYELERHKHLFKYVVIRDADFSKFIDNYQGEYGSTDVCKFVSASDFFLSLGQAERERYFRENNKPIRSLSPGAQIHVGDYRLERKDEIYDDAAELGLSPLYDLTEDKHTFKYIVCRKEQSSKYLEHNCERMTAKEFDEIVAYMRWMEGREA